MKSRKFKRGEQFFFQIIDENGNVKMESKSYSEKEDRNKALEEAMKPYASKGNADDYKPLNFYESNSKSENGFDKFEADGEFYFCYCVNGVVHLISEGYSSESGRDNGISSVEKNMVIKERFSVNQLPNGKWYLNLKAGNHQEIATSRWYNSEGDANNALAALTGDSDAAGRIANIGVAAAPAAVAGDNAPKKKRKKRTSSKPKAEKIPISEGLYTYNNVRYYIHKSSGNGQYYFSFKNPADDKTILMNSDVRGFGSEADADAGVKRAIDNANVESNYDGRATKNGKFWFYLTDGKGNNVGKSIFFGSEEDMQRAVGLLLGPVAGIAQPAAANANDNNQDEYLPVANYQSNSGSKSDINGDFITFEQDGQYYFAWMVDGKVYMRSQGYTAESGRDNGINSVIKNRELEERYAEYSEGGDNFVILKAGNNQEIARSGPIGGGWTNYRSAGIASLGLAAPAVAAGIISGGNDNAEAEAKAKAEEEARLKAEAEAKAKAEEERKASQASKAVAAAAAGAGALGVTKMSNKNKGEDDDYLVCSVYEKRLSDSRSSKYPEFITFKADNGEHYFALVKDGKVYLRSEGYTTAEYRDNGIESVIKNKDNRERYSVEKKRGMEYIVLKSSGGHEIARSCPMKDGAAGWLPAAAVAATATAAAVKPTATKKKVVETTHKEETKVRSTTREREPVAAAGGTVGGGEANGGCMRYLPWLLLLLIPLLLFGIWKYGCNPAEKVAETATVVTEKAAEVVEEVQEAAVEVKEEVKEVVKKEEPKYEPPSTKGYKSSGF
jgi:uncharacterized protein YegP (UPF0339 family)